VLIAEAVFHLEHEQTDRQTDKQTDVTECPTHAGGYKAGMGNKARFGRLLQPPTWKQNWPILKEENK